MCDERERLIGYVYDECDDGERTLIDRHLASCATCRDEIAGLRETRQDLLAWEVPDHGSVWRPFAPARLTPWYREVPAWALATAASVMLMLGVGGGIAAQALLKPAATSAPQMQVAAVQPVSIAQTTQDAAALRAELNALEARMMSAVRANNTQFTQHVSAGSVDRVAVIDSDNLLASQVRYLSGDLTMMWKKVKDLEERNRQLNLRVETLAGLAGAGAPSR